MDCLTGISHREQLNSLLKPLSASSDEVKVQWFVGVSF
jgi:hypothetical protein